MAEAEAEASEANGNPEPVAMRQGGNSRWQVYVASRDSDTSAFRDAENKSPLSEVDLKRQTILNKRLNSIRDARLREADDTPKPVPLLPDSAVVAQQRIDMLRRKTDEEMREYESHRELERQQEEQEIQRILERREQRRRQLEADEQRLASIRSNVEEQRRNEETQRRQHQLELQTRRAEIEDRRRSTNAFFCGSYLGPTSTSTSVSTTNNSNHNHSGAPISPQPRPVQNAGAKRLSAPPPKSISATFKTSDSPVSPRWPPVRDRLVQSMGPLTTSNPDASLTSSDDQSLLRTADHDDDDLRAYGPKAVEKFEILADRVQELELTPSTPADQLIEQLKRLHEEMVDIDDDVANKAQLHEKQELQIEQLRKLETAVAAEDTQQIPEDQPDAIVSRRVSVPTRVAASVVIDRNETSNGGTGNETPKKTIRTKRMSAIPRFLGPATTVAHE